MVCYDKEYRDNPNKWALERLNVSDEFMTKLLSEIIENQDEDLTEEGKKKVKQLKEDKLKQLEKEHLEKQKKKNEPTD